MEGLWFLPWAPAQPHQVLDTDTWFRSQTALLGGAGGYMALWVWALHADGSRDDMSFLPKALRGSQTPERGAQPLPSSGTQPSVAPGALGISAKP